jgi:hypothetical protein
MLKKDLNYIYIFKGGLNSFKILLFYLLLENIFILGEVNLKQENYN